MSELHFAVRLGREAARLVRAEKRAGVLDFGLRLGKGLFGGAKTLATHAATKPLAAGGRAFSPTRALGSTAAAGYGGYLGGVHTGYLPGDPTYGMNAAQRFQHHSQADQKMLGDLPQQLESARASGDNNRVMAIIEQMRSGQYGGTPINNRVTRYVAPSLASGAYNTNWITNNAFTRTFAPFMAGDATPTRHHEQALGAQNEMQGQYDSQMDAHAGAGDQYRGQIAGLQKQLEGTALPAHRDAIQKQISALQQRLATPAGSESPEAAETARLMREAGMAFRPRGPAPAAPMTPSTTWATGRRPDPSVVQSHAISRYDFQRNPWDAMAQSGGFRGNS